MNWELRESIDLLHGWQRSVKPNVCAHVGRLGPAKTHRHHESFTVKEEMWAAVKPALS